MNATVTEPTSAPKVTSTQPAVKQKVTKTQQQLMLDGALQRYVKAADLTAPYVPADVRDALNNLMSTLQIMLSTPQDAAMAPDWQYLVKAFGQTESADLKPTPELSPSAVFRALELIHNLEMKQFTHNMLNLLVLSAQYKTREIFTKHINPATFFIGWWTKDTSALALSRLQDIYSVK